MPYTPEQHRLFETIAHGDLKPYKGLSKKKAIALASEGIKKKKAVKHKRMYKDSK